MTPIIEPYFDMVGNTTPSFVSIEDAQDWMEIEVDDHCMDNYRFAFKDDDKAMDDYENQIYNGCCGSFDADIIVLGREATIGCNYGH